MLSKLTLLTLVAAVYGFGTMEEEDSNLCIVKKDPLSKRSWTVGLGDCANGVYFEFNNQGGHLKTATGLCLGSRRNNHKLDVPLVLDKCSLARPGQQWTFIKNDIWMNGNGHCIVVGDHDRLVQADCSEAYSFALDGCNVAPVDMPDNNEPAPAPPVVIVKPAPPPPAPVQYTCASLEASGFRCPAGYMVPKRFFGYQCASAPEAFVQNCCVPAPQTRTCAEFSVQRGGPTNVCDSRFGNFELTRFLNIQCSAFDNRDCFMKCCVKVEFAPPTDQTCQEFVNNAPYHHPACGYNMRPIADLTGTDCPASGYGCRAICCEINRAPTNQLCGDWLSHGYNRCGNKSPADSTLTCAYGGSDCEDICCVDNITPPPPQNSAMCSDWLAANVGGCGNAIEMKLVSCEGGVIEGCNMQRCCGIPKENAPVDNEPPAPEPAN